MTGARAKVILMLLTLAAMIIVGCNALLDFDSFKYDPNKADTGTEDTGTTDGNTEGGGDGGCIDPTGFGGKGCYRCTPTTQEQLLSACTTAKFETFDNAARIKDFDPTKPQPDLPVDAGPYFGDFDAGPTTSSTVDGGTTCPINNVNLPVMVLGATGFPMEVIASSMGNTLTMFYKEASSCLGVGTMVKNAPKFKTGDIVAYWDANGTKSTCTMGDDYAADIGISGLFTESCAGTSLGGGETLPNDVTLPPGVADFLGPVNPAMFAVPATSLQKVISAEAGYRVYGFGSNDGVPLAKGVDPWIDETHIFRRTATSGTQQIVARSLGLPLGGLRGRNSTGSGAMLKALRDSDPAHALGISTSEVVDVNRSFIKSLAYQHYKQPVGFYPDSDSGQFDRRNIRDGHYFLWIVLHVIANTKAGDPIAGNDGRLLTTNAGAVTQADRDAAVKKLVFVMVSREEPPVKSVNIFNALKVVGNVPQCAMRVTRKVEGGNLEPFLPSTSCGCAFEAASPGTTSNDCKSCTGSADCVGTKRPTCSFGYCE